MLSHPNPVRSRMLALVDGASLAPLRPGRVIETSDHPSADKFLSLSGFELPEPDGVWTSGPHSQIAINIPAMGPLRKLNIAVRYRSLTAGTSACASIDGGEHWFELPPTATADEDGHAIIPVPISTSAKNASSKSRLLLEISNPVSPRSLGIGADDRLLGLKIASLELVDEDSLSSLQSTGKKNKSYREEKSAAPLNPIPTAKPIKPRSAGLIRALWRSVFFRRLHPQARKLKGLVHDIRSGPILVAHAHADLSRQVASAVLVLNEAQSRNDSHLELLQSSMDASFLKHAWRFGEAFEQFDRMRSSLSGALSDQSSQISLLSQRIGNLEEHNESQNTRINELGSKLELLGTALTEAISRSNDIIEVAQQETASLTASHFEELKGVALASSREITHFSALLQGMGESIKDATAANTYLKQGLDEIILWKRSSESRRDGLRAPRHVLPMEDTWLIRASFGYIFVPHSEPWVGATLMEEGDIELGTRLVIERILEPGDTFLDVGTNVGIHMLAGARATGPLGRVYAFEPTTTLQRPLEMTISLNNLGRQVVLVNAAVGESNGATLLHHGQFSGHNSIYPLDEGANSTETVNMVTLDECVGADINAKLMKIDAEGAELAVLAGAKKFLEANPAISIIAEFSLLHLAKSGHTEDQWFAAFEAAGRRRCLIINEDGTCTPLARRRQLSGLESVNLLFAPKEMAMNLAMEMHIDA